MCGSPWLSTPNLTIPHRMKTRWASVWLTFSSVQSQLSVPVGHCCFGAWPPQFQNHVAKTQQVLLPVLSTFPPLLCHKATITFSVYTEDSIIC